MWKSLTLAEYTPAPGPRCPQKVKLPIFSYKLSSRITLLYHTVTPGHAHHPAQEKPPEEEQAEEATLPKAPPFPEPTEEKVERSLSVASLPQAGHRASFSSLLDRHRNSNSFPHSLHLNSYIGINTHLPKK